MTGSCEIDIFAESANKSTGKCMAVVYGTYFQVLVLVIIKVRLPIDGYK